MAHHNINDLLSLYLRTAAAALIAVGAATNLDVDLGRALLSSLIAAAMPVFVHLLDSRGQ